MVEALHERVLAVLGERRDDAGPPPASAPPAAAPAQLRLL
jgi:hypothetical protein